MWTWLKTWLQSKRPAPHRVEVDEHTITHIKPNGESESVRWDRLRAVVIVTTDQGPWVDDVFWILVGRSEGEGCIVPSQSEGTAQLLDRLQALPGFDNMAVIRAMGSTDNDEFPVWAAPGQAA